VNNSDNQAEVEEVEPDAKTVPSKGRLRATSLEDKRKFNRGLDHRKSYL
jgi:hypothetical protein